VQIEGQVRTLEDKGFAQMMDALEVGRVNVAARGVGIAQRALELALRYTQERRAFGKPSPSTRRSSSSSPTWRPRSRPLGC
jgi:alkylation response protein AidB-like acyl-CoA dehydrogenase